MSLGAASFSTTSLNSYIPQRNRNRSLTHRFRLVATTPLTSYQLLVNKARVPGRAASRGHENPGCSPLACRSAFFVSRNTFKCLAEEISLPDDLVHAKVFANVDTIRYLPDPFRDFHYPYNIQLLLRLACFLPHDC